MKFLRTLVFLLLALAAFAAWHFLPKFLPGKPPAAKAGPKTVPVTTTVAETRNVPIWLSGLGTVQAFNTVTIRPRVGGALEEVNFTEGQAVKAGDVLARIDPRPYQSVLDQAKAKRAQSATQLANARRELERVDKLVGTGAESRRRYEELEANVGQLAAQEQADAATVGAAELDLEFTAVKAPIAGRTGVRLIDPGNLITAGQNSGLVVITQLQPVSVILTLPQEHLPAIRKRMLADKTPLTVQTLADDGRMFAEGKLELIDNQIDVTSGTLRLKATFPNDDLALWPGQFVTARVLVDTRNQAIVVPTPVVQAGLDGPFAYVVKADKTVEARNLKAGPRVGEVTVIEDGLKAGEQVVLDGQSKLQPGAAITLQSQKL